MLRNREFVLYLAVLVAVTAVGVLLSFIFFTTSVALIVGVSCVVMIVVNFVYTMWRYREVKKLSTYLRQISSGDFQLDVRDNKEGELSILKNEIYKVTRMLSEQSALLQQDNVTLVNAISDISHQLKTPLTSMMVMADLLNDKHLHEEKRAEFIKNIRTQLERIEWLVSSLLKLSKIDAGTVRFKKEIIPVHTLVNKAIQSVLIPMDIKHQTLNIEGNEQVCFTGDFNWTTEALLNILNNCVEHTEEKGTISISYSENILFTEIIISDNGKGIAKDDLPYIFQRFYKGKNASDDSVGIGLAMAHTIITNQQGDLEVSSEIGSGTQFVIKFYKGTV